jgi:hypothetical protein
MIVSPIFWSSRLLHADALAAVQRPLPYHGRARYLALQDSQAVVIGTWPRDPGSRCIDIGQ